jgi:hypothetical protein
VKYRVDLLPVARTKVPGPQIFWMSDWFVEHELCFQVALIRGGDIVALVNTGTARDLSVHTGDGGFFGEGATMSRAEDEFIIDQLARHEVSPADVTHIVLAPLTLYAAANVTAFPNAEIAISRTGWVHFHTTHEHPHDDHDTLLPPEIIVYLVTEAWPSPMRCSSMATSIATIRSGSARASRRRSWCIVACCNRAPRCCHCTTRRISNGSQAAELLPDGRSSASDQAPRTCSPLGSSAAPTLARLMNRPAPGAATS